MRDPKWKTYKLKSDPLLYSNKEQDFLDDRGTRLYFHFFYETTTKISLTLCILADGQAASRNRNIHNPRYRMKQGIFFLLLWDSLRKSRMTHEAHMEAQNTQYSPPVLQFPPVKTNTNHKIFPT